MRNLVYNLWIYTAIIYSLTNCQNNNSKIGNSNLDNEIFILDTTKKSQTLLKRNYLNILCNMFDENVNNNKHILILNETRGTEYIFFIRKLKNFYKVKIVEIDAGAGNLYRLQSSINKKFEYRCKILIITKPIYDDYIGTIHSNVQPFQEEFDGTTITSIDLENKDTIRFTLNNKNKDFKSQIFKTLYRKL